MIVTWSSMCWENSSWYCSSYRSLMTVWLAKLKLCRHQINTQRSTMIGCASMVCVARSSAIVAYDVRCNLLEFYCLVAKWKHEVDTHHSPLGRRGFVLWFCDGRVEHFQITCKRCNESKRCRVFNRRSARAVLMASFIKPPPPKKKKVLISKE